MRKELAEDAKSLESFYREARACAALNHTNIIHIYTFDEIEGQLYLVMELADRGSLDQKIEQQGRLSELQVLDIGIIIGLPHLVQGVVESGGRSPAIKTFALQPAQVTIRNGFRTSFDAGVTS